MNRPPLYINHISEYDWLVALEFGRVDDSQPSDNWRGVSDEFGYLHEKPGGRVLGFKVIDFSEFDVDDEEVAEIWDGPRFDVPMLGLRDVPAGEVILGARASLSEYATVNRAYFNQAIDEPDPEQALKLWRVCLQTGDSMAHFGLGYTLYELGDHAGAYRHLRHYTEIAPHGSWIWLWFGKAAEKMGERDEAIAAYTRALELEADGDAETDAAERLEPLIGFEGLSKLRDRLNRETDGTVDLHGQFDWTAEMECPVCGWRGTGKQADLSVLDRALDLRCPSCDRKLVVVSMAVEDE